MEFMELKAKIINSLAMGIYQQEISWRKGPSEKECLELATQEVEELIALKGAETGHKEEGMIGLKEKRKKGENFWARVVQTFFLGVEVALFVLVFSFVMVVVYQLCAKLFSHF